MTHDQSQPKKIDHLSSADSINPRHCT